MKLKWFKKPVSECLCIIFQISESWKCVFYSVPRNEIIVQFEENQNDNKAYL